MTPQIALDLSLDGIAVLSRAPADHADAGKWWREGTVRLDASDMADALRRLRDKAAERTGPDFTSILILPDSQLLYTSLERDDRRPQETIRTLLKGRTPYEVEDLTFDFVEKGDRLQVAVVAKDTLSEAETFASDHGFRPVAVVANPREALYPGVPRLGQTSAAAGIARGQAIDLSLGMGFTIVPAPLVTAPPAPAPDPGDDAPKVAPAEDAASSAPADPAPAQEATAATSPTAEADEPAPATPPAEDAPSFASRRRGEFDGTGTAERIARPRITPRPATSPPPPPRAPAAADEPDQPKIATPQAATPAKAADGPASPATETPPLAAEPAKAADATPQAPAKPVRTLPAPDTRSTAIPSLDDKGRTKAGLGLGLVLTLVLLALLASVGVWSVIASDEEAAIELARTSDPAPVVETEDAIADSPLPAPEDEPEPVAQPSDVAETPAPDAAEPPATDVATLLPSATDGTTATSVASPIPDLVTPPLPLPGATPEELVEAEEEGATREAVPEVADAAGPTNPATDAETGATTTVEDVAVDVQTPDLPAVQGPPEAPSPAAEASVVPDTDIAAAEDTTDPDPTPAEADLVAATTEGAVAPGGYRVVLGRPEFMPTPRPVLPAAAATPSPDTDAAALREALSRVRPVPRPATAVPAADPDDVIAEEETPLIVPDDGLDEEERAILSRTRPQPRPTDAAAPEPEIPVAEAESAEESALRTAEAQAAIEAARQAAGASLAAAAAASAAAVVPSDPISALAIAQADRPRARPRSIEQAATRAVDRRREQAAAPPPAPVAQQADSGRQQVRSAGGDVARAATERNVIRLNQMNLIGVYGRPSDRRALVRLRNGRYVKVEVGDRLDRGRVTSIGEDELRYQRGSRNVVLRLPQA